MGQRGLPGWRDGAVLPASLGVCQPLTMGHSGKPAGMLPACPQLRCPHPLRFSPALTSFFPSPFLPPLLSLPSASFSPSAFSFFLLPLPLSCPLSGCTAIAFPASQPAIFLTHIYVACMLHWTLFCTSGLAQDRCEPLLHSAGISQAQPSLCFGGGENQDVPTRGKDQDGVHVLFFYYFPGTVLEAELSSLI